MYDQTPLGLACEHGHLATVCLLLERSAPYTAQLLRDTPLHLAAQNGHTDIVQLLLSSAQGAHVNEKCGNDETALFKAAKRGHVDTVRALLSAQGVDVEAQDERHKMTARQVATLNDHGHVVLALDKWAKERATEKIRTDTA